MGVPACPSCGNSRTRFRGEIPDAVEFAGRELSYTLHGGGLWECITCSLQFRFPSPRREDLNELYRCGAPEAWNTSAEERVDWELARRMLDSVQPHGLERQRLLDVGCWDGRFLASVKGQWELNGIEINPVAARLAAQRGISLVGDDLAQLELQSTSFDAITAFDVIEHVPDPATFVRSCARLLKPGGSLIVATGNTASLPWRILRSRNLYCIWPEHLCFINEKWCKGIAEQVGLTVSAVQCYRRTDGSALKIAADALKSVAYASFPRLFRWLRSKGVGNTKHVSKLDYPPLWPTARDHFLVCFRKVDS
jgi:2-polyprenyl-3-methyl-5-hydroxy-6-metoxy-1,4-benzoquinol methylase